MAKLNLKPLFDTVLVKPLDAEIKTASGIILPDSAKEKPQVGEIIAVGSQVKTPDGLRFVGPDGRLIPVFVNVGDKVLYKTWGGDRTKVNGVEHILVKQGEILAVME